MWTPSERNFGVLGIGRKRKVVNIRCLWSRVIRSLYSEMDMTWWCWIIFNRHRYNFRVKDESREEFVSCDSEGMFFGWSGALRELRHAAKQQNIPRNLWHVEAVSRETISASTFGVEVRNIFMHIFGNKSSLKHAVRDFNFFIFCVWLWINN